MRAPNVRPVLLYGCPVLEQRAVEVTVFDAKLENLVKEMWEAMYAANGIGLAAPQIGISKRLSVTDVSFKKDDKKKLVLINPEITSKEGNSVVKEGCLSLPEFWDTIERAEKVIVKAQDITGKWFEHSAEGLEAQCLQHELDHLDGKLFISYIKTWRRSQRRQVELIRRRSL